MKASFRNRAVHRLAIPAIAAGVLLFAAIAAQVMNGGTNHFDRWLMLAMRNADLTMMGPPAVQEAARDITALGSVTVLTLLMLAGFVFLALDNRKRLAVFALSTVISGQLLSTLLKHLFNRPRPDLVPHAVYVASMSFPSGHSMMSAVAYLCLGTLLADCYQRTAIRAWILCGAVLIPLLVGVSRVYLGVHWPSDVLAGWTAGATWVLVCRVVARAAETGTTHPQRHGKNIIAVFP